ncbi:MAG: pantetheine-phosphate adenylyltransferase [Hyphomicrobiales bacterium]|nr:pantetheine-phosphate adenylyltransferase [Hyphomicrobiales bacterium]
MSRVALYTGSFDPLTLGHVDVILSAAALCDRLIVAIGRHASKTALFSPDERAALIKASCGAMLAQRQCQLEVISFDGLAVEAARAQGASLFVRGLRNGSDLDYEMQMAGMNRTMAPEVQTIFVAASPGFSHITATLVRQIAQMGGDVTPFVPPEVAAALRRRLQP